MTPDGDEPRDTTLTPTDAHDRGDHFGSSVALDGDTTLVGATEADSADQRTGAAYLFEPEDSEWAEQMKLQSETGGLDDRFGTSVALSDRRGFVGASDGESERMADTGAVHVFSV